MGTHSARYVALVATLAFSASLAAQSYRGAVNGNVKDATGAVVPNAAITALDTATNISQKAASSSAGEFTFSNHPIGSYTLTVTTPGFSTAKFDKVQIEAGAPHTLAAKPSVSPRSRPSKWMRVLSQSIRPPIFKPRRCPKSRSSPTPTTPSPSWPWAEHRSH